MANKKKVNRIAFVIDDSGSMKGLESSLFRSFEQNVNEITAQARKTKQRTAVSLYLLNKGQRYSCKTVGEVELLSHKNYSATGGTPLYYTITQVLSDLERLGSNADEDVSNLVIVLTDGFDTDGGLDRCADTIRRLQSTDRFTITASVPNGSKQMIVQNLGIPSGNVQEWNQTDAGMSVQSVATTKGVGAFYGARTAGFTSVDSFYTDLSGVKASTVKKQLTDLTNDVRVLKVEKEGKIREFVESKTKQPMLRGAAFYQLTKTEKKVQKGKQILVMEKNKTAIYGGPEARDLLGLPDTDVKVVPGNHANFDIFVQSTSTNRMLVRGTRVLYYPAIGVPYQEGPSAAVASAAMKGKSSAAYKQFRK